jgi:hypothetical protein
MPVDKKMLEQCIAEVTVGDPEMSAFLTERYSKNDAAAAAFVGGFMRNSDYTKKTTELAGQRQQFEQQSTQLESLRDALEAAEKEKGTILRELAGQRISTAKASELMKMLQEKYQLTDDDLPGMSDLIQTRKSGKVVDSTEDLDTRLNEFKTAIMKEMETKFVGVMTPELSGMAKIPLIWDEISREHEELTGKRLTFAEKQELYDLAAKGTDSTRGKGSIYGIWEDKYNVGGNDGLRVQKRDEAKRAEWAAERDRSDAEKLQRQALEVITPAQKELGNGAGISPAFKTKFQTYEMDPNKPAVTSATGNPDIKVMPGQHIRQDSGSRIPAAQRAATKFLERGGPSGYGRKAS